MKARELRPSAKNWRTHPQSQRDALCGALAEIGYADALIARELPDGSLELIDGHLRAETTPDAEVPVLVLDVDEREAAKLLAMIDPLANMAGVDETLLTELLAEVETDNEALQAMFDGLLADAAAPNDEESESEPRPEPEIGEVYQVVVDCRDETQQQALFERLTGEGFECRLLVL